MLSVLGFDMLNFIQLSRLLSQHYDIVRTLLFFQVRYVDLLRQYIIYHLLAESECIQLGIIRVLLGIDDYQHCFIYFIRSDKYVGIHNL